MRIAQAAWTGRVSPKGMSRTSLTYWACLLAMAAWTKEVAALGYSVAIWRKEPTTQLPGSMACAATDAPALTPAGTQASEDGLMLPRGPCGLTAGVENLAKE